MKARRALAALLAAWMAAAGLVPPAAEAAAKRTRSAAAARKKPAAKKPVAKKKTARKKPARRAAARKPARRKPTAAERAAARREAARRRAEEKRRREAARRAEEQRQREALQKAWKPEKGCYQAGAAFTEPRLKDDDPIEVPREARGGSLKAALLLYEAQLDKDGQLRSLRTLRPLPKEHPWPLLHEAVVRSLQGWKWDKTRVAGKSVPVCFPVTLNLDLR